MSIERSNDDLLRVREVQKRTGLSRSTLYNRMKAGTFPQSLRISTNIIAWYKSDIDAWVADPMGWRGTTSLAA